MSRVKHPRCGEIGRAWAAREADATPEPPSGAWFATYHDALPLVPDLPEPHRTIAAEKINEAARKRWAQLVRKAAL